MLNEFYVLQIFSSSHPRMAYLHTVKVFVELYISNLFVGLGNRFKKISLLAFLRPISIYSENNLSN